MLQFSSQRRLNFRIHCSILLWKQTWEAYKAAKCLCVNSCWSLAAQFWLSGYRLLSKSSSFLDQAGGTTPIGDMLFLWHIKHSSQQPTMFYSTCGKWNKIFSAPISLAPTSHTAKRGQVSESVCTQPDDRYGMGMGSVIYNPSVKKEANS